MSSIVNIIENGRAKFAFEAVNQLMEKNARNQSEVRSYIKRLPVMIQTNGLGQALAFYYSKRGIHKDIYLQLGKWFSDSEKYSLIKLEKELIEEITNMNRDTYRFVTNEVIELLNWMRRFADGYGNREDGS